MPGAFILERLLYAKAEAANVGQNPLGGSAEYRGNGRDTSDMRADMTFHCRRTRVTLKSDPTPRGWGTRLFPVLFAMMLLLLACGGANDLPEQCNYVLKYLVWSSEVERNKGGAVLKVLAIDTRTNTRWRVEESFMDKIREHWCLYWDSLSFYQNRPDTLPVTWSNLPEMQSFMVESAVRLPPGAQLSASVDSRISSCYPEKGLFATIGSVAVRYAPGRSSRNLMYFCSIYDATDGTAVIVDTEAIPPGDRRSRWPQPFFDSEGSYLYYKMDGLCKRYELASHRIDTVLAGDSPIIPWNGRAAIVYSTKDKCFRLLDDTLG
jgi:hypothetical protein